MSSRRLPGKVARPILGRPMLGLQIERVLRAKRIDRLVVATSTQPEDDRVAEVAEEFGASVFRGSLEDVLDRFYRAAEAHRSEYIVRLTGDCPLADPQLIDAVIEYALNGGYDYASNTLTPTWPDGLDVEVVRFETLAQAWRDAGADDEREHVMPYIWRRPQMFSLGSYEHNPDQSNLRWTVDEPEDFDFVSQVYERLYPDNPAFTTSDILGLLAREPDVAAINAGHERNEGFQSSSASDTDNDAGNQTPNDGVTQ